MYRNFTEHSVIESEVSSAIRQTGYQLNSKADLKPLFDYINGCSIVMLGEASHGTHEYYRWRTYISQKLIEEKGFNFIAVEGDWPDCYRLNRFIKGYDINNKSAYHVLHNFKRWPTWMWANWEIVALADWLQQHNMRLPLSSKVGFYGLDVYSLWESLESIMHYLKKVDPAALKVAEEAFRCFEPYRHDEGTSYARSTLFVPAACQQEVVELLREIQHRLPQYDGDYENVFNTEQNALVAVNAEKYYRAMVKGGPHSWNVRDSHMADTLERLLTFHGKDAKAIVWAHNTHFGDARATDMTRDGMYNIGELARVRYGDKNVSLIGFGSYKGSVTAGRKWGAVMQTMPMPKAREGSWEYLLHKAGKEDKLILMNAYRNNDTMMENHIDHRAIGVVYNPQYEQYGNYVPSILPLRYDAFIYLDNTSPLHPIHIEPDGHLVPETYPFGV